MDIVIFIDKNRNAHRVSGSYLTHNSDIRLLVSAEPESGFDTSASMSAIVITCKGAYPAITATGGTFAAPVLTAEDIRDGARIGFVQGSIRTTTPANVDVIRTIKDFEITSADPHTNEYSRVIEEIDEDDKLLIERAADGYRGAALISALLELLNLNSGPQMMNVDAALSLLSENPVQNKVITEQLQSKYEKPSGGIPVDDLASGVQSSLDKADTALQHHQSLAAYRTAAAQDLIDGAQDTAIAAKYAKPSGGIPKTDLASAVKTSLGKADTAYQKPSGGIPVDDLASGVIPSVPSASSSAPLEDGVASAGSSTAYAKGDHRHPHDTSKQDVWMYSSVTIAVADWEASGNAYAAVKTVTGITTESLVFVKYSDTETEFSEEVSDADEMTFGVAALPSAAITVDVSWFTESAR